jgi:hypothetical protein
MNIERELSDAELDGVAGGINIRVFSIVGFISASTEEKYQAHQAYPSMSPSQQTAANTGKPA